MWICTCYQAPVSYVQFTGHRSLVACGFARACFTPTNVAKPVLQGTQMQSTCCSYIQDQKPAVTGHFVTGRLNGQHRDQYSVWRHRRVSGPCTSCFSQGQNNHAPSLALHLSHNKQCTTPIPGVWLNEFQKFAFYKIKFL